MNLNLNEFYVLQSQSQGQTLKMAGVDLFSRGCISRVGNA
jgi:hypothetical protein